MAPIFKSIKLFFKSITIEPVIFLFILGNYILLGSQVPTDILIFKICHYEMNISKEVCDNLDNKTFKAVEEQVQTETNDFQMTAQWINNVPGLIFSLYAGPLSDVMGRKPLMMFPVIGYIISSIGGIINYAFLDKLPIEFFYIDALPAFFGGLVVYYLGQYSYGASVTEPEERGHRIARLDGTEYIATMIGTLLSPLVTQKIGYFGNYGLCGGLALLAVLYLKLVVKEPIKKDEIDEDSKSGLKAKDDKDRSNALVTFFVTPLVDMVALVRKKRPTVITILIVLQLAIYCAYIFVLNSNLSLLYLYMLLHFEGFEAADYAYFSVSMNVCSIFCLIIVMPIVSGKLNASDSLLLLIISGIETVGYALTPFTTDLKLFYVFQILCTIGNCKFPLGRSLLSKYCEADEVGKMYSIQSILISLTFMISNPIVRQLYDFTLSNFAGAYFLLNASLLFLSGFGNLVLFIQRKQAEVKSGKICQEEYTTF